jgi:hypothetical protein
MVNGRLLVAHGELLGVDLQALITQANQHAVELVRRTEQRYNISVTSPVWRRAFPYDSMEQ